ncbi:tumor necrosis factor receptor superfamily member 4 [Takifugu rubripes]|uniref:tumor necrosis factor receptor superfamily member 4 n=1 Tax=Takifugu rubripes TaxID=31033 RepID=UPI0005D1DD42|nr:tumor necrosis factor receptor superfamily member 4-like [Takifugu rubripes]|eukprot:XP_011612253.1 PREDICTED: tumor necrosis factor receptor superfamily member 4-like [Takifugu rubripes]
MFLLKLPLFILTLYGLILNSAANCPEGQRVVGKNQGCEDCKNGYFQETVNYSQYCKVCKKCDKESGSDVEHPCTTTSNTICKCRKGFVASDNDFSTCQCKAGFGKKSGECTECEDGHFSKSINSPCQKYKECKYGVNITGTKTSDVICNSVKHTDANAPPTPSRAVSPDQLRERVPIQKVLTTAATTMTTPRRIPHSDTSSPSRTTDPIGFLITFATVGLLMLTAVIIKLYIIFYLEKHESGQKHESTCGRPVEEIGGGSEVCLKLTLEEN